MSYLWLLSCLFVVSVVVGAVVFVLPVHFGESIDVAMKRSLIEYDDRTEGPVRIAWDEVQRMFKCCGIESAQDWQSNNHLQGQYPRSCCRLHPDGDMLQCESSIANTWWEGCLEKVKVILQRRGTLLSGTMFGVAFLAVS
ncbi:unnamed protein product [Darwinula stevensoni]|uniref:Uncharacterized protein n=1 Tax=Darwinula stevensoni TaxID=69355 RepID=A0A7R9AJQ9_9CRUS|nr:unnamed protein product [Darwinula stevensoni]CAG0907252.1 unnamed protein product [Darwinula stevensoni]